ncbi:hypothetical protein [Halolactibacillus sp. JCM 19043]|nr:hypothetical protein [Halolactibacillus sp. JCM 19043]
MGRINDYKWVIALVILLLFGTILILTKKEQALIETPLETEETSEDS